MTGWMYSINMESASNPYRCRQCGAASYARLVQRRPDGVMAYANRYRCSGCSLTFSDPAEWRRTENTAITAGHPQRDTPSSSSASFSG